jgi:hypothetical protein
MAAIAIKTNLPEVANRLKTKLAKLRDREYLLRPVCTDLIDLMTQRIHMRGEASDSSQIGTYSKRYLLLRQKKYKRSSDTKVIVSLTRQLENDWAVIATKDGYGIGFKNRFNLQKARWVEAIKDRIIFKLTDKELEYAKLRLEELVSQALNNNGI